MTTATATKTAQRTFKAGQQTYTAEAEAMVGTEFFGYPPMYMAAFPTTEEADAYESYRAAQGHKTTRYTPEA